MTLPELIADRYERQARLGSGASAEVFRVRDRSDGTIRALKVLRPRGLTDPGPIARALHREFRTLLALRHPHLIQVHDFGILPEAGDEPSLPWFTMDLVPGRPVDEALGNPGDWPALARIADAVLDALGAIHAAGLVHGDVTTANVLLAGDPARDPPQVWLMDLGLVDQVRRGEGGVIRGTPATIPPETLRGGDIDARADLYSFGCVLYRLATGEDPFVAADPWAVLKAHLATPPTPPSHLNPDVPRILEDVILALLAKDPADRPPSAHDARSALAPLSGRTLKAPRPLARALAPSFTGRDREMSLFAEARERLARGEGGVLVVSGPAGIGRSRLLEEMRLATRLSGTRAALVRSALAPRRPLGAIDDALAALGTGSAAHAGARPEAGLSAFEAALASAPTVLLIDDAHGLDAASSEALSAMAARAARHDERVLFVLSLPVGDAGEVPAIDELLALGLARLLRLRSLETPAIARLAGSMLGRPPLEAKLAEALAEHTAGVPARLVETIESLVASGRDLAGAAAPLAVLESLPTAQRRRRDQLAALMATLSPASRRALGALALSEGAPIAYADVMALAPDAPADALDDAIDQGLVARVTQGDGTLALRLEPPSLAQDIEACLPSDEWRSLHRARAHALLHATGREAERARHLARAGDHAPAAEAFALAARRALDAGAPAEAVAYADGGLAAARSADIAPPLGMRRTRAQALWQAGRANEAEGELVLALEAARSADVATEIALTLRVAGEIEGERGLAPQALAHLEEALSILDELADTAGGARVLLEIGRVLAREARHDEALARFGTAEEQAARAGDASLEAEIALAGAELASQRGLADVAEERYRAALESAVRAGDARARRAARRGVLLAREASGRLPAALSDAEAWLEEAQHSGDRAGEADARAILGRVLARLGRRTEALQHLEDAARARRRTGHPGAVADVLAESARVMLHRGQPRAARERAHEALSLIDARAGGAAGSAALYVLAEVEAFLGHAQDVERLLPRPDDRGDTSAAARAERGLRLGEALMREGQSDRAREVLQEACFLARRVGNATIENAGLLALTEAYLDLREDDRAMLALKRVRAAAEQTRGADELLARARLLAAERELIAPNGDFALAMEEAELAARSLIERERRDLAWRAQGAWASAARRAGDMETAQRVGSEAFRALDALLAALPEADRPRWRERPRVRAVIEMGASLEIERHAPASPPGEAVSSEVQRRMRALERLVAINRSLNSARDPRSVLQVMLDTAIELTGAERGFVMLEEGGRSVVELARGAGGADLAGEEREASREAARRVMADGTPLLAHDALTDERLASSRSIHALRIRSILAAPLRVRGQLVGAIVMDSRRAAVAFGGEEERLLGELADQAGIALSNARLVDELRRQAEEIRSLNDQLSAEVEEQRVEILEKQSNLEVRYRFDCIIGAAPPMQKLYRALEKLIPTEIPVLVTGESGTGKDLVARVLHYNGPRREKRYVTVNCAALTDTLLESELFGHRKGAFTGADRDRRGLFEQADGGTLFLDEIGEMPMPLQPKLLRALQFGEVRRVGEDTPRHVDVRIVAATNRDVMQAVATGRFREDLMYRLDVGRIHLPPLRERLEDIGLLVDHFLEGSAKGSPKKAIEPPALRLFLRHDWPGNVRELENEVTKLATFTEGPVITEVDVLENATFLERARARGMPIDADDDVGTLEEAEIARMREALKVAGGNRTRAAQMLGIDRSTLYRKLKRLGSD